MKKYKNHIETPTLGNIICNIINHQENSEAYFVGGCVRDSILGIQPKDWDIVTNLTPDRVVDLLKEIIGSFTTVPFKIFTDDSKFGVIRCVFYISESEREEYEIVTFRGDGEYTDNRRPDSITFGDMPTDSKRRDFTINAMYYNPSNGEIIDFHNGMEDIKNKVIRTVGNPLDRFSEDRLRILRAYRFAMKYNFTFEYRLEVVISHLKGSLFEGVSLERQHHEFNSMFKHSDTKFKESEKYAILREFLEQIQTSSYDLATTSCSVNNLTFIEAVGCTVFGDRKKLKEYLSSLRFSKNNIEEILFINSIQMIQKKIDEDFDPYTFLKENKHYMAKNSKNGLKLKVLVLMQKIFFYDKKTVRNLLLKTIDFELENVGQLYLDQGFEGKNLEMKIREHNIKKFNGK